MTFKEFMLEIWYFILLGLILFVIIVAGAGGLFLAYQWLGWLGVLFTMLAITSYFYRNLGS
ncbi:Phosphatidylserine decarboxylase [Candidatus Hepatincola sp. Av]